jgi:hypothetical protein
MSMVSSMLKIGQFLRILDDSGQISLTNITVYITMYKLATSPVTNYTDIAALVAALSTYTVKKIVN